MEAKPFGGFALKQMHFSPNTESEDSNKNEDPELQTMIEEEPEYPDEKTTMDEIQKKALAWQNHQKSSSPKNRKGSEELKGHHHN